VHPLHDEVPLVLVDGRELDGQAVVGREPVLATKPSACSHPTRVASSMRDSWEPERNPRSGWRGTGPLPGSTSSTRRQAPMPLTMAQTRWSPVASTATPVLELDPEDRFLAVLLHRHHPGRPGALRPPVVDLEADQVLGHDLADGQGPSGVETRALVGWQACGWGRS